MVSMPSQRFLRRRFSSELCWLSSWLAIGMVMVRVEAAFSMAVRGTLPPMVGQRMTRPWAAVTAAMTSLAIGRSMGVRTAL